jgi:ABC-type transport system involved in multi-copper enzyme maturation permease subunit
MPVFDQGYQHWNGQLSGHTWRWLTIARQGVRVALQNLFLRFFTLMAMFPALLLVAVLVLWGLLEQNADFAKPLLMFFHFPPEMVNNPGTFRGIAWTLAFHFFFKVQLFTAMILVLMVGPGLISQDLRFNAIPLYFSRPLLRWDYFLGKLGVIGFFLMLVAVIPALVGYVLGVLLSFKFAVLYDTWHLVPASIAYGLVIVVSAGTLMLALSSLSRSSRYVAAFWMGLWIITMLVASVLSGLHAESTARVEMDLVQRHQPPPVFNPNDPADLQRQRELHQKQQEDQMNARFARQVAVLEASLYDWRPMISYTANLDRVGRFLFGVDAVAERVATEVLPPQAGPVGRVAVRYILSGPQYGWYWSALVLLVLFGASLWLLTTRVRSLDQLS